MRRLILLRHAKSDWADRALSDHDRPLAARGRAAAPLIGKWLAQSEGSPDRAVVSTARRTRETWALVARELDGAPEPVFERRIYEARASDLLDVVRETPDRVGTLLMVGHNPGMAELAARLVGAGDGEARLRMARKFPTAAVAVMEVYGDGWADLAPRTASLVDFVTPRDLDGVEDE